MIGIFLRELRENLKWAAVICALVLFLFVHETRNPSSMMLINLAQRYTFVLAPLAGLLMGVVQSVFEMRPDNWAFVVHRPVPRLAIFIAKCAAGMILLFAALAIPCIYVVVWAIRPGNQPMPFQARMMLPMLADITCAGCYYFAAMVMMLRKARWYGSRLLPIGFVLSCSAIITMFVPEFWQAEIAVLIATCIGAVAAWGAFATNGGLEGKRISRLALSAMLYPGVMGACFFVIGFSTSFDSGGQWDYYQVDHAGNIVRVTLKINNDDRSYQFHDQAGQPLSQYQAIDLDDPANADLFLRFNAYLCDSVRAAAWPDFGQLNYRGPAPGVVSLRTDGSPGSRLPYMAAYVVPARTIELVDAISNRMIGTVSPAGFSAGTEMPAERFPGTPLNLGGQGARRVLPFDTIVYWMELNHRSVRPIFTPPADDLVISACEIGPAADPTIVLITHKRLHVLKPSGKEQFSVLLPADPAKSYFLPAIVTSNQHILMQIHGFPGDARPGQLVHYAADGALIRQTEFPRPPDPRAAKWRDTALFGALFPLAAKPICPTWVLDDVLDIRSEAFATTFSNCLYTSAIVCAITTLVLGRWYGLKFWQTLAWAASCALFGPTAVGVFLSVNERPARERCAVCGHLRIIGPGTCPNCHTAPITADLHGHEIFEPDAFQLVSAP